MRAISLNHFTSCGAVVLAAGLLTAALTASAAEDRRERVLTDRAEVQARGDWVYNDLPQGIAEAKRTGKPLLVVFRCIP